MSATADVSALGVLCLRMRHLRCLAHISGRMTEVIRLVLYTEVLGPSDGDLDPRTPEESGLHAFFCLITLAVAALFPFSHVAFFALLLCILLLKFL